MGCPGKFKKRLNFFSMSISYLILKKTLFIWNLDLKIKSDWIQMKRLNFSVWVYPMQYMGYTYSKKEIIFLKFRFNWCPVLFLATVDKSISQILTDLDVLRDRGVLG